MATAKGKSVDQDAAAAPAVPVGSMIDHAEITDLRAYQRTFDGAYARTALGQLSYAILILRLFERDFYWCGLVYTVLAVQLICVAVYRYNLAVSNETRYKQINTTGTEQHDHGAGQGSTADALDPSVQPPLFRRTFRTAGSVVAWTTIGTLILEIALAVLVLRM